MSKRLIQLTLSPEEAVWLYCAMAAGHHLALATIPLPEAEGGPSNQQRLNEIAFARQQAAEAVKAGHAIDYPLVAGRIERLIKACEPEGVSISFLSDNGDPR